MLVAAQDGDVYVTRPSPGDVLMLRDTDGDGKADERKLVAKKSQAHSSAVHDGMMYLATVKAVYAANISEAGSSGTCGRLSIICRMETSMQIVGSVLALMTCCISP